MGLLGILPEHTLAAARQGALAQTPGVGSLTGTVSNAQTGQPVANAFVRIVGTDLQATTGASGRFTIPKVPVGTVQVSIVAPGHLEVGKDGVSVAAGNATSLEIELLPTPNFLEQVQVTASKEPLSIGDVPAQANIIDRSQIVRKGDLDLTQAVANIPGVIVSNQYDVFKSVMMRGMPRAGNEFQTTLLLIDGVPQTDSRNSARVANIPINDVSSIEVVRGPNSALYGRTAIGGSINILTAEPTVEHRATFDSQAGQFGHLKQQVTASGPVQNWGGYYLSAASNRSNGYHTQSYDFKNRGDALFTKFTFTPDDKSHGSVTLANVTTDNGLPTGVPIVGGRFLSDIDSTFDPLTNLNTPTSNYHQDEFRSTVNYRRQLTSSIEFVEVFGFRKFRYRWTDNGAQLGAPFDLAANTVTQYPFEQTQDEHIFYQDAHVVLKTRPYGMESTLVTGVTYERSKGFVGGNFLYTDPVTLGWPVNYLTGAIPARADWQFFRFGGNDYRLNSTGVFGQFVISPVQRLLVNVGGRYDRLNLHNVQVYAAGQPQIDAVYDAFSPKVSATVKLLGTDAGARTDALNLYAAYSRAFLPPRTPNNLAPADATLTLEPEKIKNYEVGLKGNLFGSKLGLEGTFFRMQRDGIVVRTQQGPFFLDNNAGVQKFRGVEIGASWAPWPALSFYANSAFYHTRFGTYVLQAPTGNTVLTGKRPEQAPDIVYNTGVTVDHHSGWGGSVNLKHVGGVFLDPTNTFSLEPYTVVDGSVSWNRNPVRLTLAAHNLFDRLYFNNGSNNAQRADVAPPRQVVLSASFSFR
jgi:outer membrane receptor protein involved in Fe transport